MFFFLLVLVFRFCTIQLVVKRNFCWTSCLTSRALNAREYIFFNKLLETFLLSKCQGHFSLMAA